MGVVSHCVRCLNCGAKYRLRYNVGNKFPQTATFPCGDCGEDLTVGVDKTEKAWIEVNVEEIEADRSLKVVNLHPEVMIDPDQLHDPMYFPSIDSLMKQRTKGDSGIFNFKQAQLSCVLYQEHWDKIKKDLRYLKEKRWNLLEEGYGNDKLEVEDRVIGEVIRTVDYFLLGEWRKMFPGIRAELKMVMEHTSFPGFKAYLLEMSDDVFYNKMYGVMTRYRDIEAVLLPTLLDQKCGFAPEGVSSKIEWDTIKHFYGEVYEIIGDMMVVPSAMNNLIVRGDFKKFATPGFDLEKYIDTDKAGRNANFSHNAALECLGKFYVAGIRNGTHHEASTFDKATQTITLRTGKGGKILKTMQLIDYIAHCNELYARLLIIFRMYSTLTKG